MGSRDHTPLLRTLRRAAAALREADIPFALGGGYAAYARGADAPEHDVDFLIVEEDVDRALKTLVAIGMRAERPPEDWLVKAWDPAPPMEGEGPRSVEPGEEILVDLLFRTGGREVSRELIAEAEELEVASLRMPVISATHLLVSKLRAFSAHSCDFAVALPVARALREQIDWDRVRRETADSPYAVAFVVLLEQLDLISPENDRGREDDRDA